VAQSSQQVFDGDYVSTNPRLSIASWYYLSSMSKNSKSNGRLAAVLRAVIEVAFIIFLFYSNLLMGEFNATNGHGKTLAQALSDILTAANFSIAVVSAMIGYVVFEYLRKRF
jgi:hypothetical protein